MAADWAELLAAEFGSLGGVLSAGQHAQHRVVQDWRVAKHLELVQQAICEILRRNLHDAPVLPSLEALLDYVRADFAYARVEQAKGFFLDAKARLIHEEILGSGSVDQLVIHPREVVRRSIEVGAVGLIMVHNHPSGDTAPSDADVATTRQIAAALNTVGVRLHDHVVIGSSGWTSMRVVGLI